MRAAIGPVERIPPTTVDSLEAVCGERQAGPDAVLFHGRRNEMAGKRTGIVEIPQEAFDQIRRASDADYGVLMAFRSETGVCYVEAVDLDEAVETRDATSRGNGLVHVALFVPVNC